MKAFLKRNWKVITTTEVLVIMVFLLFAWPGWAWNWRAPRIQPYEVVKEVPVEKVVVKEVPVETVVTKTETITVTIPVTVEIPVTETLEVEVIKDVPAGGSVHLAVPASSGVCRLDKIGTWSEVSGAGPHRIEVGGHGVQHADYYPERGVKSVSYIVDAILPPEVPAIWYGFGSIWEGTATECQSFDWIADATAYAKARLDSGHSGLVVDVRGSTPEVVANVAGLKQEIDDLLKLHSAGMQSHPLPPVTPPPTATPAPAVIDCSKGSRSDHLPVVGQTWQPGPEDSWRVINFWTNESGHDQSERKLLLEPGKSPKLFGGGSSWSWPSGCENVVRKEYAGNPHPEVTLEQLIDEGLVKAFLTEHPNPTTPGVTR